MQNQACQTPRVHYTIRDLNFVLALMESEKSTANGTSSIVATEFDVGDVPLSYNITEGKTADHGLDNIGRRLTVYYFTGQGLPVYVGNETLSPNMEIPLESRYAGFPSKHELTLISAHSSLRVLLLPKSSFHCTNAPYTMSIHLSAALKAFSQSSDAAKNHWATHKTLRG